MKTKFLTAALAMFCALLLTSCSKDDDNNSTKPIDDNPTDSVEHGKIFSYTYQNQTLYYLINNYDEASVLPPLYLDTLVDDDKMWTGYDKPVGAVVIPDHVPYCGHEFPVTKVRYCTFLNCYDITSVTLPSTIKVLGDYCFASDTSLVSINLPESIEEIGEGVFENCRSLKECVIPAKVKELPLAAFLYCNSLTSVKLPEGLTTIGDWAFSECAALQSVNLPEGLTTISDCAFRNDFSLTDITFPSTLTKIGGWAFQYAENIGPDIVIPEGVDTIGDCAFGDCYGIESIKLPSTLKYIGEWSLAMCVKLDNIVFPDHMTHLAEAVLFGCESLTTCHLPAQLQAIDQELFYDTAIDHIDIPEHVTSIGPWAFGSCLQLKELTLPASVTEMADSVFSDDTRLDRLTLECTTPPTVTDNTFEDDNFQTALIVPKGAAQAYRRHDIWGRFTSITEKE